MTSGPADTPSTSPDAATSVSSDRPSVVAPASAVGIDCRSCPLRPGCISYGWRSPGGVWFENMVILRPKPGCRGFVGRGGDIRSHFEPEEDPTSTH